VKGSLPSKSGSIIKNVAIHPKKRILSIVVMAVPRDGIDFHLLLVAAAAAAAAFQLEDAHAQLGHARELANLDVKLKGLRNDLIHSIN